MANSKVFSKLEQTEDGVALRFNKTAFQDCFDNVRRSSGMSVNKMMEELAKKLNVSAATVSSWRRGQNGPGDIDLVKRMASILNLTDYHKLLSADKKGGNENMIGTQKTIYEMNAARRMYEYLIDTIERFYDIFNNRCSEYKGEFDDRSICPWGEEDGEPNDLCYKSKILLKKLSLDIPPAMQEKILDFIQMVFPDGDSCYSYVPHEDDEEYEAYKEFERMHEDYNTALCWSLYTYGKKEATLEMLKELFSDYLGY